MANQAVVDFVNHVEANEDLKNELTSLPAYWLSEATKRGNDMGYDFSEEELYAYVQENYSEDLSDEMLDAIAGGTNNSGINW
jgi:predicted ribosomally synthesized peptide with nif11-like leader